MTAAFGKVATAAAAKVGPKVIPAIKGLAKGGKLAKLARVAPFLGAAFAVNDLADGNYLKGTVGLLGLVPGPVGWAFSAAYVGWSLIGDEESGGTKVDQWAPPDGTNTHILPGEAKGIGHVPELDGALTKGNRDNVFAMGDGPSARIWQQEPLPATRMDTPEVAEAVSAYLKAFADISAEVRAVLDGSGEPKIRAAAPAILRHLAVLDQLPKQGETITKQLKTISDAGEKAYGQLTSLNKSARQQLSSDGALSDPSAASNFVRQMEQVEGSLDRAEKAIAEVMKNEPLAPAAFKSGSTSGVPHKTVPTPTKTTPAPTTNPGPANAKPDTPAPAPKTETPAKDKKDDLANALKGLQNAAKPTTPSTPSMPNLGGGGGTPNLGGGGANPMGGQQNPLAGLGDKLSEKKPEEKKKDEPIKKREEPKKPDLSNLSNKPKPAEQKPEIKPDAPAAPVPAATVPGDKKPEEENKTPKPGAPKPNTTVDMKGTKVEFPNERVARMAELLGKGDAEHPVTLTDAAAEAGLTPPVPGQDPGQQIAPSQAKPGDLLVAGDRQFLYLGDGKFYADDYKVVGSSDVPELGDKGGWFHLGDPGADKPAGDGQGGGQGQQGPVSGPTQGGTQFENPAAGTETKPAPGSDKPAGDGQSGSGSGGTGTPSPGAPASGGSNKPDPGVTSSGAPNAPVNGGPAVGGDRSTATGSGTNGVSSGSKPLDPSGIVS